MNGFHTLSRPLPLKTAAMTLCTAMLLCAAPAAVLAAAPTTGAATAEAGATVLDRKGIDALLATPGKVLFLDVRRADEISTIGGFPVFLNIQAPELERSLAYIPRDRQIVTVSNHAARAKRAAALLSQSGFKVAGAAGVQDYEAQGGVLVGRKPETATAAGPAPTARAGQ